MLEVKDKKRATGPLDRRIKMLVQQICCMWDEVEDFERLFAQKLSEMKQVNHIVPKHAYRLTNNDGKIEVWHINNETSMPDRLLCEVESTSN